MGGGPPWNGLAAPREATTRPTWRPPSAASKLTTNVTSSGSSPSPNVPVGSAGGDSGRNRTLYEIASENDVSAAAIGCTSSTKHQAPAVWGLGKA
jgi:hypothetical protein